MQVSLNEMPCKRVEVMKPKQDKTSVISDDKIYVVEVEIRTKNNAMQLKKAHWKLLHALFMGVWTTA